MGGSGKGKVVLFSTFFLIISVVSNFHSHIQNGIFHKEVFVHYFALETRLHYPSKTEVLFSTNSY